MTAEKGRELKDFPVETNGEALVEAIRMIPGASIRLPCGKQNHHVVPEDPAYLDKQPVWRRAKDFDPARNPRPLYQEGSGGIRRAARIIGRVSGRYGKTLLSNDVRLDP